MNSADWPSILGTLSSGQDCSADQTKAALGDILAGSATPAQIAAFIVALRTKGESVEEIAGLNAAMLAAAVPLQLPPDTIDIVGTGGSHTLRGGAFNVSTLASIVAAAAGATVCKHGNRKASSTSGSTDMLEALGVAVDLDAAAVEYCVSEVALGFCFARVFHPAMRYVAAVRAELGIPTVFNILGPLSHPGHVSRQLLGVADPKRVELIAAVLLGRSMQRALVVHGDDGLDEITTTTTTQMILIEGDQMTSMVFEPESVGLQRRSIEDLVVGNPEQNAVVARAVLAGEHSPHFDLVVVNAGAGLYVAGEVESIADGVHAAAVAIESGAAADAPAELVVASHHQP